MYLMKLMASGGMEALKHQPRMLYMIRLKLLVVEGYLLELIIKGFRRELFENGFQSGARILSNLESRECSFSEPRCRNEYIIERAVPLKLYSMRSEKKTIRDFGHKKDTFAGMGFRHGCRFAFDKFDHRSLFVRELVFIGDRSECANAPVPYLEAQLACADAHLDMASVGHRMIDCIVEYFRECIVDDRFHAWTDPRKIQ